MITIKLTSGQTRTGLWCGSCFLPSAISIDVVTVDGGRVLGAVTKCPDCGDDE